MTKTSDESDRFIINFNELNGCVEPPYIKMEDIRIVKILLTPNAFMCSIALTYAFFLNLLMIIVKNS